MCSTRELCPSGWCTCDVVCMHVLAHFSALLLSTVCIGCCMQIKYLFLVLVTLVP